MMTYNSDNDGWWLCLGDRLRRSWICHKSGQTEVLAKTSNKYLGKVSQLDLWWCWWKLTTILYTVSSGWAKYPCCRGQPWNKIVFMWRRTRRRRTMVKIWWWCRWHSYPTTTGSCLNVKWYKPVLALLIDAVLCHNSKHQLQHPDTKETTPIPNMPYHMMNTL